MSITPRSVHDERSGICTNGFRKLFRAFLDDDVTPSNFTRECSIEWGAINGVFAVLEFGNDNIIFKAWFTLS